MPVGASSRTSRASSIASIAEEPDSLRDQARSWWAERGVTPVQGRRSTAIDATLPDIVPHEAPGTRGGTAGARKQGTTHDAAVSGSRGVTASASDPSSKAKPLVRAASKPLLAGKAVPVDGTAALREAAIASHPGGATTSDARLPLSDVHARAAAAGATGSAKDGSSKRQSLSSKYLSGAATVQPVQVRASMAEIVSPGTAAKLAGAPEARTSDFSAAASASSLHHGAR